MLTIITQSGYEANSVLFSAFAFSGSVLIIKTVVDNPEWRSHALLIIGLLPSYLLFLSGGLKESVLLFGAGMLFLGYYNAFNSNNKWLGIVQLAIGCWLLIIIKPYFIASILPAILAYQITQRLKLQSYFFWGIWGLIIAIGAVFLNALNFEILEYIVRKQHDFLNHTAEIMPGSAKDIPMLEYTWKSLIIQIPSALWRSLFEPMPWNIHSPSLLMLFIENIIIGALSVVGLVGWFKTKNHSIMSSLLLQSILPGLCLIGLIFSVLGATMRYRAPFIILLILAILSYLPLKPKNLANNEL